MQMKKLCCLSVTITAGAADNEILISNVWDADPNSSTRVFLIDESEPLGFPHYGKLSIR